MTLPILRDFKCSHCPIRHRAVCAHCDTDELQLLENIKSYRSFSAGESILWRGEPLDYVASVVTGVAALSKTLEDGRTQMVGLLLPSDFMGRPGRKQIAFDVTATTDVTLCCFDRKPFEKLVNDTPHLTQRLMELALDELDAARDWMLLLGRKTAREKIATFIEMLARRVHMEKDQDSLILPLSMTRDQIANFLGLTLETVSRQFNALKKDGIIDFSDRKFIAVKNIEALHAASGDDS
ncbi:transcriptional regulator FnrL [Sulfitobacter donghicola]|nr:Crp/Fnr family transcriptional regulator [Sulfitobacter donghicola]